ncbi:hypothetical protein AADZ90_016035 [Aestuariibius sp. 2305UL40-4]|uniref:COG4315 family predicted lipoprotein n=1 Tax=Aestuariibius violaceus TaxID=3234132 RepID=UPI00345E4708
MKLMPVLALGVFVAGCDEAYAYDYSSYGAADATVTQVAGHGPLTAANGMTVYTFDNDAPGVSNCYGDCAVSWPPYGASAGEQPPAEGLTTVERRDGTLQWAKDGEPLYFWVGDTQPGDTTGDGVGGVWHVAS